MQIEFLGTGNAGGVPLFGCGCPACARATDRPQYRRGPASVLVTAGERRILIDAGLPDLKYRLAHEPVDQILLTHYHIDHVQGLFAVRWGTGRRFGVIGPEDPSGCDDLFDHPGILDFSTKARAFEPFVLGDVEITPLPLQHSRPTLGYHLRHHGRTLAYLTDTSGLPSATSEWLGRQATHLLVVDCSYAPGEELPRHHNDLPLALQIVEEVAASRCLLTHLGHRLDSWLLEHADLLPPTVGAAYDALTLDV